MSTKFGTTSSGGFTLVEVAIVIPIMVIIVIGMVSLMINLYYSNIASLVRNQTTGDIQTALRMIDSDVDVTKTLLVTTDANLSDPYGPDNNGTAWNMYGTNAGTQPVLLLRMYATTTNLYNPAKSLVYVNQSGCNPPASSGNTPLMTNVIYFVRGATLYRRVLTDTSKPTCGTPFQQQTCPADVSPKDPVCKVNDTMVLANVSSFQVDFRTVPGNTQLSLPTTQPTLDSAVGADVNITVTVPVNGSPSTFTGSIYTNKKNT